MKKHLAILAMTFSLATTVYAVPVTIEFDYEIVLSDLHVNGTVIPSKYGNGAITFDNIIQSTHENYSSDFGNIYTTNWNTDTTQLLNVNSGNINGTFAWGTAGLRAIVKNIEPYRENVEIVGSFRNTNFPNHSMYHWNYTGKLYATRLTYPRDPNTNYNFTSNDLFNYWNDFLISGESIRLWETCFMYDRDNSHHFGYSWYGTATVTAVYENQPVPEPATCILFGTGLIGLGLFNRIKNGKNKTSLFPVGKPLSKYK